MSISVFTELLDKTQDYQAGYCVLVDPDTWRLEQVPALTRAICSGGADAILVGGSLAISADWAEKMAALHQAATVPVLLFPGSLLQLTPDVDAVLFLSLLSGRNPRYLIGEQVQAAPRLKQWGLESIPTAYLLVESGQVTTVEFISDTRPLPRHKPEIAVAHALAAEFLGFKLIYLEAGSGASQTVPPAMVRAVKSQTKLPLMVGGGIKNPEQARELVAAGARFIVIGNALEDENVQEKIHHFADAIHG